MLPNVTQESSVSEEDFGSLNEVRLIKDSSSFFRSWRSFGVVIGELKVLEFKLRGVEGDWFDDEGSFESSGE